VALFWPIEEQHEVDLRPLEARLRARGVRVAFPAMDAGTGEMAFRFVEDPDQMQEHGFGFREPRPHEPEAQELDVIVAPALAVDPAGHRIGYGAGYYDRALPRYVPPAVAIAVAYDYQLVAEVPATATDVAVAWVVTDVRTLRAGAASP
jgi:5-formyltetrahydrofolate cyclo-ligase